MFGNTSHPRDHGFTYSMNNQRYIWSLRHQGHLGFLPRNEEAGVIPDGRWIGWYRQEEMKNEGIYQQETLMPWTPVVGINERGEEQLYVVGSFPFEKFKKRKEDDGVRFYDGFILGYIKTAKQFWENGTLGIDACLKKLDEPGKVPYKNKKCHWEVIRATPVNEFPLNLDKSWGWSLNERASPEVRQHFEQVRWIHYQLTRNPARRQEEARMLHERYGVTVVNEFFR